MSLYVPGDLVSYPDAVRGPDRPQPGAITCVDDSVSVSAGQEVTITPLTNDFAADGAPLYLLAVDAPSAGTVSSWNGTQIVYRSPSSFTGTVSLSYLAASSTGAQALGDITITVTVASGGTISLQNGWGPGPKSGFRYWLGARTVGAANYNFGRLGTSGNTQAYQLNRNHDILDAWNPYTEANVKNASGQLIYNEAQQWAFIAGCPGWRNDPPTGLDSTDRGGCMGGSWQSLWSSTYTLTNGISPATQGYKVNLAINPSRLSTKPQGSNPQFWFRLAAGEYDVYYRRLGRRCGYGDITNNIQSGWLGSPSAVANGHYDANSPMPRAPRFMVIGWEINDSQYWAYFNTALAAAATIGGVAYPPGTFAKSRVAAGLSRIVEAFSSGYLDGSRIAGNQKNCPWFFGTRATARKQGGDGLLEVLGGGGSAGAGMTQSQASLFQFVGQSLHHTEQACTPSAPNALWFETPSQEGLNQIGELANKWDKQWQVLFDETGQHFGNNANARNANERADLFWRSIDAWLSQPTVASLRGGLHFYQGATETNGNGVAVSDTSLIVNPAGGMTAANSDPDPAASSAWWDETSIWWFTTYQNLSPIRRPRT